MDRKVGAPSQGMYIELTENFQVLHILPLKSNLLKINITGLIDTTATIITIGKLLLKIQQVDGVCFVGCLTKKTLYCRIFPHFHLVSSICITAIL